MKQILILRKQARGDVLLCTPVIRRLKELYPESYIYVRTDHSGVLSGNPNVQYASGEFRLPKPELVVDLEVAYEKMHGWHLIDAFNHAAKLPEAGRRIEVFPRRNDTRWAEHALAQLTNVVVLAPGPGLWEGRNWPEEHWRELAQWLKFWSCDVVLVGSCTTYSIPCDLDLRGHTTLMQLAAVIGQAKAFVGIDSFPAHVAGAMRTPRVVLFGITSAKCILCDAPKTVAVESSPDHPFTGARHHVDRISSVRCGNPQHNPMNSIRVAAVQDAIQKLINE